MNTPTRHPDIHHTLNTRSGMTNVTERLMTSEDVANLLRVPRRSLDQWSYLGTGPAFVRIGRYRRYRPSDLEKWLKAKTAGG
jgi:predicted DNA-binding transcriptional regulator AlpA